jgi:gluconolactonase
LPTRAQAQQSGPDRWALGSPPVRIPDPDVLVLDPAFAPLTVPNALIERAWTGGDWLEGPAWSNGGRFLVFSDVRRDCQYRMLWENGAVSVFRTPSGNSNGNIFDHQGRQVICQHLARRVVRVEHDGSVKMLAGAAVGSPLNSPNDLVSHPDGSIWFTDPIYGRGLGEGQPDEPGDPGNRLGQLDLRIGAALLDPPPSGHRQPAAVYRIDASGRVRQVLGNEQVPMPNGLAFSPDFKTLYVSSTASRDHAGGQSVHMFAVEGDRLAQGRVLFDMVVDGQRCSPDGLKVDRGANLWCAISGPPGYTGVVVLTPAGKAIGRIRLPEVCANVSFGGPRRDTLFMTATRSIYRLQLNIQGAAPS